MAASYLFSVTRCARFFPRSRARGNWISVRSELLVTRPIELSPSRGQTEIGLRAVLVPRPRSNVLPIKRPERPVHGAPAQSCNCDSRRPRRSPGRIDRRPAEGTRTASSARLRKLVNEAFIQKCLATGRAPAPPSLLPQFANREARAR